MERGSKLVSWVVGAILLSLVVAPSFSSAGEDSVATQAWGSTPSLAAPQVTTPPSPVVPFSARGTATFTSAVSGACPSQVCTVNLCECWTLTGTATSSILGASTFVLNLTLNDSTAQLLGTDNGPCGQNSGFGTLSTKTSSLKFQATGQDCNFRSSSQLQYDFNDVFYFIPGQGTGQTLASTGAGTLTLIQNFKVGGIGSGLKSAIFDIEGVSQMKP
jgi:hypothetical protein